MAHFDPRVINSTPRAVSGVPILIGIGLVLVAYSLLGLAGLCARRKRWRAGLFRTRHR